MKGDNDVPTCILKPSCGGFKILTYEVNYVRKRILILYVLTTFYEDYLLFFIVKVSCQYHDNKYERKVCSRSKYKL